MSDLTPKIQMIRVKPGDLIPDQNNPRFTTKEQDLLPERDAVANCDNTLTKMRRSEYQIQELKNSIQKNGWTPVDKIFVRKLESENGRYLVLEGNRRVTAVRDLLQDEGLDEDIRKSLQQLTVAEIIDDLPDDELRRKINYLLGVRHHGSLKPWSAFAQANDIYKRYLRLSGQNKEDFKWVENPFGKEVAESLNIKVAAAKNRLQVFRAMEQLGDHPDLANVHQDAGVKGKHYSLFHGVLAAYKTPNKLTEYIGQDDETFLMSEVAQDRMLKLCKFENVNRADSPIVNPREWAALKTLMTDLENGPKDDFDEAVRAVENGEQPSLRLADLRAELYADDWSKWLQEMFRDMPENLTSLGGDFLDEQKEAIKLLDELMEELGEQES